MISLFIGNLSYDATEQDIRDHFHGYLLGTVKIPRDRDTNRPRGFGFAECEDDQADQIIEEMNCSVMLDRTIRVNVARPKEQAARGRR